ncbi:MAG: hypothetical protein EOP09_05025 [Proteobacteria bacterium]|nr:MAG: hypothetical protein EOP09_05025 [Pseudomonadota bacterium]
MKSAAKPAQAVPAKPKKSSSTKKSRNRLDPLYVIFERHLFNFADPDSDRAQFIATVVDDYLNFLKKQNIIVPRPMEHLIVEELATQVNTMLVKKIYGCLTVSEYQGKNVGLSKPRRAQPLKPRARKAPPTPAE